MIRAVPKETPVTIPVPVPAVATPVLLLVHAPPVEASDNAALVPEQIVPAPVIAAGNGSTVTVVAVEQPGMIS